MAFTGKEDHSITLEEASKLTRNYRDKIGKDAVKSGFFGKETLQRILDQNKCVGIRIYLGEENGTPTLVLVGADADGNDITEGILAEKWWPCPPFCPENSVLSQ